MSTNERAASQYFSKKIRTLFARFDMDRNNLIEIDDFEKWCDRLAQIGKLDEKRTNALADSLLAVWQVFFLPADSNQDGSIEIPELVIHMKATINDPEKRKSIENNISLIFDAIDTNGDGAIEADELANYYSSFGITDKKFAIDVFNAMDSNHDGALSKEEFAEFGMEFFLGTNPASPARFFFGPLVN